MSNNLIIPDEIRYDEKLPKNISKELIECSKIVNKLDKKMSSLGNNLIEEFDLEQNQKNKKKLIALAEKNLKVKKIIAEEI